ncbi:MAG: hypothetical protein RIF37_01155 [Rhodospirillaceae bacterium]
MSEKPYPIPDIFSQMTSKLPRFRFNATLSDRFFPIAKYFWPSTATRVTDGFASWLQNAVNINLYFPDERIWQFIVNKANYDFNPPGEIIFSADEDFFKSGSKLLNSLFLHGQPFDLSIKCPTQELRLGQAGIPSQRNTNKAPETTNIRNLNIELAHNTVVISGLTIAKVTLSAKSSVRFINCTIGEIRITANEDVDLRIFGTRICSIVLGEKSLKNLKIIDTWVRSLDVPQSFEGTPYSRYVQIIGSKFSTVPYDTILDSAQGYSRMRGHLEKSGYSLEAHNMRTVEMQTEWHHDRGFSRLIGAMYGVFSGFGGSPARAFAYFITFYIITAVLISIVDGGELAFRPLSIYVGWREIFLPICKPVFSDATWCVDARLSRSWFLPLQTMFNPLGIFNSRTLVVAATVWGQVILVIHSVLSAIVLFTLGFSLRRRFKIGS